MATIDRIPTQGGFDEIRIKTNLASLKDIHSGEARIAFSLYGPKGGPQGLVHMTLSEADRVHSDLGKMISEEKARRTGTEGKGSYAYRSGRSACEQGLEISDNPYSSTQDEYMEWENGWTREQGDREAA